MTKVSDFYRSALNLFGQTEEGLGWGKKCNQTSRFRSLSDPWDMKNSVILDVGAGFGDLFDFLRPIGIERYIGLESSHDYAQIAVSRHTDERFAIVEVDIQDLAEFPQSDIAIGSGVFNVLPDAIDPYIFVGDVLRKSLDSARKGISFNFLTDDTMFRNPDLFYANSAEILRIAKSLSRKVAVSHEFMPFEFDLTIWKSDTFNHESARYV